MTFEGSRGIISEWYIWGKYIVACLYTHKLVVSVLVNDYYFLDHASISFGEKIFKGLIF